MAYSQDYRERVLEFISEGNSQKEAIRVFKISKSTIQEWQKLKEQTGSLKKKELDRKARKYHPDKLNEILNETPDAYLYEIAEKFEKGTISGVNSALKRYKITLKKKLKSIPKEAKSKELNTTNR
jgi:transposase